LKEFWNKHRKPLLAASAAIGLAAIAGTVVWWYATHGLPEEPKEVTSAWPVAQRERTVRKPEEPVRWPLTGEDVSPADSPSETRITSVRIDNSQAARPQTGLDMADIVYESLTEGGITRFNALFHSQIPSEVGPVRSARLFDTQLVPQYSALFAHSGANTGVLSVIRGKGIEVIDHSSASAAYRRVSYKAAPHNLYVDLGRAREIGISRGYPSTQELKGLHFSQAVESTVKASRLRVPFSPANSVMWEYDEDAESYRRYNNGRSHTDRVSGDQYVARNVVVMWARTSATGPSRTLDITLTGEGRASVFRDGVRIDGTWEATQDTPPVFRNAQGALMRLAPGNTWFQVVPPEVSISVE